MFRYYMLDDALQPVGCDCVLKYQEWHESMPHETRWYAEKTALGFQLARDMLPNDIRVSTVYLAMDHGWGDGPPVLWETMVFDDSANAMEWDKYQNRYCSHAEAIEGHRMICRLIASEGLAALTDGRVS